MVSEERELLPLFLDLGGGVTFPLQQRARPMDRDRKDSPVTSTMASTLSISAPHEIVGEVK